MMQKRGTFFWGGIKMCHTLWLVLKCAGGSSRKGATKTKRAYRTTHAHHRGETRPESRPNPSRVWQGPFRVGWAECASPIRPRIPGCLSRNAAAGDPGGMRGSLLLVENFNYLFKSVQMARSPSSKP